MIFDYFFYCNSEVSSWFCRSNDPLICPCPVINVVVSQECFKGLPLKFYFQPFDDICSNRKWNLWSAVNRKWQPEILFWNLTVKLGSMWRIVPNCDPEAPVYIYWITQRHSLCPFVFLTCLNHRLANFRTQESGVISKRLVLYRNTPP